MFDGLFKSKFHTKCKALVRITKTRVETVKRKKNAVCRYLKNDIVDLLKNNLDYNAYSRAEGLIEEQRRLSCYESLEEFCICVASNVPLLQKSSKCPDECREAVSSLVYAAARVSEVPELRDLRSLFADRYGSSLEQFVNPEFVERFKTEPPSKEMKLELLQEIAREYSIKWDTKSLEQRLYTPLPHYEDKTQTVENRSEEDDMSTSDSCISGSEEDPETKPFYYRSMPAPYINKTKLEKQESLPLPEKITGFHLTTEDADEYMTDSPTTGKPKPRSVRRRLANPPRAEVEQSKNMRSVSMEEASGEGDRRIPRRTASWNVPDFDEVAARVNALTRK